MTDLLKHKILIDIINKIKSDDYTKWKAENPGYGLPVYSHEVENTLLEYGTSAQNKLMGLIETKLDILLEEVNKECRIYNVLDKKEKA